MPLRFAAEVRVQKSPFCTPSFLKDSPDSAVKLDVSHRKNVTKNITPIQDITKNITPIHDITENITPMPEYEQMLSPALRLELRRFGLKVIPRRNAVPLLKHLYEETHPQVRRNLEFNNADHIEEELSLSQESNNSGAPTEDFPEESKHVIS